MNIPKILEAITQFILHFDPAKYFKDAKFAVLIFTIIFMLFLLFGALFSLLPQF